MPSFKYLECPVPLFKVFRPEVVLPNNVRINGKCNKEEIQFEAICLYSPVPQMFNVHRVQCNDQQRVIYDRIVEQLTHAGDAGDLMLEIVAKTLE